MAVALTRKQQEYILTEDKELSEDLQTKFFIKPLSAKKYADIQEKMKITGEGEEARIQGSYYLDVLKEGLVGWSNFKDAEGNEIKFNNKNMDDNLDYLSVPQRFEISGAIMSASILGEQKEKTKAGSPMDALREEG